MIRIKFTHDYNTIISLENLLAAWREFLRGKTARKDVQLFSLRLVENIFELHKDLSNGKYRHGPYEAFKINDPKPRNIHKSQVRDRLLHHAFYRQLYPFFDRIFIADYPLAILIDVHYNVHMNIKNIIPISQARKDIFSIAKQVQRPGQHFTLTENGHPKLVVLSASEFESLVETVEVLGAFPELEDDIDEAENEYRRHNIKTLDEILAGEGYIRVTGKKKKHGLQSRSTRKSR